eukprot:6195686-Pleurochrysis_carterae.AAC.2
MCSRVHDRVDFLRDWQINVRAETRRHAAHTVASNGGARTISTKDGGPDPLAQAAAAGRAAGDSVHDRTNNSQAYADAGDH